MGVWSMVLATVGLVSLYLTGKPRWRRIGWYVGIVDEIIWCAYAAATAQWAFFVSATAYAWVYANHLRKGEEMAWTIYSTEYGTIAEGLDDDEYRELADEWSLYVPKVYATNEDTGEDYYPSDES